MVSATMVSSIVLVLPISSCPGWKNATLTQARHICIVEMFVTYFSPVVLQQQGGDRLGDEGGWWPGPEEGWVAGLVRCLVILAVV